MNDLVARNQALPQGFDYNCYLKNNPDIATSWDHDLATHWILYGQKEGRKYKCDAPVTPTTTIGNSTPTPTADQISSSGAQLNTNDKSTIQTDVNSSSNATAKKINPLLIGGVVVGAIVIGIIVTKMVK